MVFAGEAYACEFCGAVVHEMYWADHVNWHETLDAQATMLLQTRLIEMEANLHEQSLCETVSPMQDSVGSMSVPVEGQERGMGETK